MIRHASRTRSIGVAGGALYLEERGQGIPVLLLHGWTLDRRVWRPQLDGLAGRFRMIAIDRRGCGRSSAPPGIGREIEDLLAVQRSLELDRMVVVGMSQGGRVALHFALAHPESVLGLVLQGAPLDGFAPDARGKEAIPLSSYAALLREGQAERMKKLWLNHPLMVTEDPATKALTESLLADYSGRDLLAGAQHALPPIAGELDAIYAPTLVMTGTRDTRWRRLVGDALAYGLLHARRTEIEGAGHLCNLTHPVAFNALLTGFIDGIAGRSPKPRPGVEVDPVPC